ncbi:unnamed protein product [Paramecium pentaurelia]|uniref:J domain-containing protein n=1 Tax=Paramecium pentaurelia TaxID=43138 RepID=A0A8S1U4Q1_9CILI|nr:unnamed protein product [Paramecium pentaurelia]
MGNIVSSNSNNSNIEQPNRRKPRIFGEKENNEPRSLIKFKQEDQSDAESEIVPIQIPEISHEMTPQKQEDIYKVIIPSPRSDLGSEIEQLWNKAVQEQSCQLAKKIITTYLEDGTMYNGEWFKGTMHGNGTLSREGLLLYEGEWKLGKKSGNGVEYYTRRTYDKIIPACQISDKQYWKVYNGTFEDDKIHGEGILELINGSCVFGEFANGQLHGQLTYECIISKQIVKGIWNQGYLYRFSSQTKCLYKILNVSTDASQEDIKASFFELAKKYHPDSNPETSIDPEKFREIQSAYSTLSNPEKRKYYDQENGIIGQSFQGNPTFGEQEDVYQKWARVNREHIKQNEAEYSDYFEKQYFRNPDYFKHKVDEDSPWNMSYNLYKKHYEIKKQKSEYVLHVPTQTTSYWEKKSDFQERTIEQKVEDLKKGKSLFIGLFVTMIIGGIYYVYQDQNQNKQRVSQTSKVKEGSGYKVKALPLNIA